MHRVSDLFRLDPSLFDLEMPPKTTRAKAAADKKRQQDQRVSEGEPNQLSPEKPPQKKSVSDREAELLARLEEANERNLRNEQENARLRSQVRVFLLRALRALSICRCLCLTIPHDPHRVFQKGHVPHGPSPSEKVYASKQRGPFKQNGRRTVCATCDGILLTSKRIGDCLKRVASTVGCRRRAWGQCH